MYTCLSGNLHKMYLVSPWTETHIALKCVARELVVIASFDIGLVLIPFLKWSLCFNSVQGGRQHLCHKNILPTIIVQVSNIRPHGTHADFGHHFFQCFPESAVSIVEVQVIFLEKVIGNIEVNPAILI